MRLKKLLKPIEIFGKIMNKIITTILLIVVYFFGIGITSLIAKMMGKNFLETETAWRKLEENKRYYKQF